MFEFIKKRQQSRLVRQLLGIGRKKTILNMDQMRSVGIVFTVGDEQRWNSIYNYARFLTKQGKDVWLCGFQPKELTLNYIFSYTQSVICHEKSDTLFYGAPKEGVIDPFTSRHYNLLLDITDQPNFFGQYVALKSYADLKASYVNTAVEPDPNQEKIFDFMIRGDHPIDIDQFFEETSKYLSMIKK